MKSTCLALVAIFTFATTCFSQMDVTPWLKEAVIHTNTLKVLRVPEDKMPSYIANDLFGIQRVLNECKKWYESGGVARGGERNSMQGYIDFITHREPAFPLEYYKAELDAYVEYSEYYIEFRRDSTRNAKQAIADSVRLIDQLEGQTFINKPFVLVKEKPAANSMTMGKLYLGSYVRSYEVENNKAGFIEINFSDYTGYINEDDIVFGLDEFDPPIPDELMRSLKASKYYKFEITPQYQSKLDKIEAAEIREREREAAGPRRKYISGPKNGCYYINSKGNRVYVDHSNCR